MMESCLVFLMEYLERPSERNGCLRARPLDRQTSGLGRCKRCRTIDCQQTRISVKKKHATHPKYLRQRAFSDIP